MTYSESDIIKHVNRIYSSKTLKVGIGDDSAVLSDDTIVTTDSLVDGVHFISRMISGYYVGWKAFCASLSDIAAMGGIPKYATIAIGIPKNIEFRYIKAIFRGIKAASSKYNCIVIGGDTVRSKAIFITVTVIGKPSVEKILTRIGAQRNDLLLNTGVLGGKWIDKVKVCPRVKESKWLCSNYQIHSMIDISDGLFKDLKRLLNENLGAEIISSQISIRKSIKHDKNPIESALYSGEDYELLFTTDKQTAYRIGNKWPFKKVNIGIIGRIIKDSKRRIYLKKNPEDINKILLEDNGYEHFK